MISLMVRAHYNFETTFRLFANILSAFYTKSKSKNGGKSIGAFEKHSDDVTYGDLIIHKISEVVRK